MSNLLILNELPSLWRLFLAIALTLYIGFSIRKLVFKLALRKNFVALSNSRSSHHGVIPNIGGVIVFVSFLFSSCLLVDMEVHNQLQYIMLGVSTIFLVGIYDDMLCIAPKKKFLGEILGIIIAVVAGGVYMNNFDGLWNLSDIPVIIGILITFISALGLVNALNLLDGIDGLSSGVAAMDSLIFSAWFWYSGYPEYSIFFMIVAMSLVPFFIINVWGKRAKMFMGDSGALSVGFLLGMASVLYCNMQDVSTYPLFHSTSPSGVVFSILSIPVLDTLRLFITRMLNHRSPFSADKNHLHHKLLTIYGGVHKYATFTILFFNILFIALGYFARNFPVEIIVTMDVLLFIIIFLIVNAISKRKIQKS